MRTIGFAVSVPANGVVPNALQNTTLQMIGTASLLGLLMACDATGVTAAMTFAAGGASGVLVDSGTPVNVDPSANGSGPKSNEDIVFDGHPVPAGSQLVLTLTNSTAAAIPVRGRLLIKP